MIRQGVKEFIYVRSRPVLCRIHVYVAVGFMSFWFMSSSSMSPSGLCLSSLCRLGYCRCTESFYLIVPLRVFDINYYLYFHEQNNKKHIT